MRHPSFPAVANVDFELGGQLVAVGVESLERLCDLGAREAWLRLRGQFAGRDDARTLLRLQGAIDDVAVERLPAETAYELRRWLERYLADG